MAHLAILGGKKTVTIDYEASANLPVVSEKGIEAVVSLMKNGQISTSPAVDEFEKKFADYVGTRYALCTNNGTSSLYSALFAVGICPGDEVIVPSYTFWASAVPIISAHGIPVFCDVNRETFCLEPEEIEKKITSRTKAIMVVHVWGNPADMNSIINIAKKYNLKVIEDCSHAHGSEWDNKKVGRLGDVGCFSLQGSKILAAGEGGVLVTDNREFFERALALGHYERIAKLPGDSPYLKYALTGMGYKYRVHPLGIAIANSGLDELDERNAIRYANAKYLEENIGDLKCVVPQKVYRGAIRQYSYQYSLYDETQLEDISMITFLKALNCEGVICGTCGYGRLHKSPLFKGSEPFGNGCSAKCPYISEENMTRNEGLVVTEYLSEHTFMVAPRFEKPCRDLVDQYIEAYHKVVSNIDELKKYEKDNPPDIEIEKLSGRSINILR